MNSTGIASLNTKINNTNRERSVDIKRTKILFVNPSEGWGGAAVFLSHIMRTSIPEYFAQPIVVCKDPFLVEKFQSINAEAVLVKRLPRFRHVSGEQHYIHSPEFWMSRIKAFANQDEWERFFRSQQADIVFLNSVTLCELIKPAKQAGAKVIQMVIETSVPGMFGFRKRWMETLMSRADATVFTTKFDREDFRDKTPRRILNSGWLDISAYDKEVDTLKIRQNLGVSQDAFVLLFMGGLSQFKGLDILLKASQWIKTEREVTVLIAGTECPSFTPISSKDIIRMLLGKLIGRVGIMRSYNNLIVELLRQKHLPNIHIKFIGMRHDVPDIMKSSDVIVFPATIPHQGGPLVEAGAAGKAVISPSFPNLGESIKDGINGYVFQPRNAKDLARAINRMICDPDETIRMGMANRKLVEMRVQEANFSNELFLLFEEFASSREGSITKVTDAAIVK